MQQLPDALAPLAAYRQFILYKLVPDGIKTKKLPVDHRTLQVFLADQQWQQDPQAWTDAQNALSLVQMCGPDHGVGFFFTKDDPFYFVDIDKCKQDDGTWSPVAMDVLAHLPGAAVEVSQSGTGLHIFGKGQPLDHACKNIPFGLEFYTEKRFVALTGTNTIGSADTDNTSTLSALITKYFPPKITATPEMWTTEPVAEWTGTTDDNELIEKALKSKSAGSSFGNRASFADLWERNETVLAEAYAPDASDKGLYDESTADMALAQHLAFWTGKNCERIFTLMWRSKLVRKKWERVEYVQTTIKRAVSLQKDVYSITKADNTIADQHGAPKLKGTPKQREFAETVRAEKLTQVTDSELFNTLCASHGRTTDATFWINNRNETAETLAAMTKAIESASSPLGDIDGPEILAGYQFLGAPQQIEHFKGCVYIQELHKIFTPGGSILKPDQFNATYGGYSFQLEADSSGKVTRKAWEAFTESQAVRYPKAKKACFRPLIPSGALVKQDGHIMVNTYVPINTPRMVGDVTPFLTHLAKVLPDEKDRAILLAYMAACIQYKGVKFQWAPLLQGCQGNGKTLFTRCVAFAIGESYTHLPRADEIAEKFNDWLFDRLFIGVEDVYVPEHKKEVIEVLKPMITNDRLAKRAMQVGQVMADVCANFILNSQHKNAIQKTRNDRRFAVFFTAQQNIDDMIRDGMGPETDYFPNLYNWLKADGYAIVAEYLAVYPIPEALNPATSCHRAPVTTSTDEAIVASMGSVEQEVLEAIDEGRSGFAGGWVSSMAFDRLLHDMRLARAIPHNKRRELLQMLDYDWHPALRDGRVNNIVLTDNGKPRLFIKKDHVSMNITTPVEVVKAYEKAQMGAVSTSQAGRAFGPHGS